MKKLLLSFAFLAGIAVAQAQNVAGRVYVTSDCASGGIDYYFYEDGVVLGICSGCEETPLVQYGTWELKEEVVHYNMTKQWSGKATGNIIPPCGSVCLYDKYTATFEKIEEHQEIPVENFENDYEPEDCTKFDNHFDATSDPHEALRNGFGGKYTEASERLLNEDDLKGLSKQELKIMRNEIFARYGYMFKTKDMADYFKKQEFYTPIMDNVDAFLSDIELKNIALIKKFEGS